MSISKKNRCDLGGYAAVDDPQAVRRGTFFFFHFPVRHQHFLPVVRCELTVGMPSGLNQFYFLAAFIGAVSGLYRDGYEVIETGPGGFFGAVIDETTGTAWFGVDDSPARLVRMDLNSMQVTGKLELRSDEERLWCLVRHGKFGYMGVEKPGGRLVGVDLEKMERLGYATASTFPLLAGTVVGDYGYFSAGSNPATIMRLHLLQMQQGQCEDWSQCRFEVALKEVRQLCFCADSVCASFS